MCSHLHNEVIIKKIAESKLFRHLPADDMEEVYQLMQTIRKQIISILIDREMTAREISQTLGIREREVYEHLPHIARSLASQGKRLTALPFRCMGCGHVFADRKRFTRPGRCPRCKDSHVEEPRFRID